MKMNLYNDDVIKYKNKKILNGRSRVINMVLNTNKIANF